MLKRCLILIFILLCSGVAPAQNLVNNGSFEHYHYCPDRIMHEPMQDVKGWFQPTDGSADYYNPCGVNESRVPENRFGYQEAADGQAYIGMHLYVYDKDFPAYKEYLMGSLNQPLIPGGKYAVSFKVSLADEAFYAIDRVGAFLSTEPIQVNTYGTIFYIRKDSVNCKLLMTTVHPKPQLQTAKGTLIRNSNNWLTVSDTIIARGYERYIVLGSFLPNNMHKVEKVNNDARFMSAYYYFDDVNVELIEAPEHAKSLVKVEPQPLKPAIDSTRAGFTFKLENIYFEFDKSYLKPESKIALRKLYGFMERHPEVKIEIQGHTDGEGSYRYNEELSKRRAISVMRYLEQRGVDESRMKTKGFGKRKPVASNDTDEGRAMNRRVMIKILPSED